MKIPNKRLLKEFRVAGHCELCGQFCQVREPHHLRGKGFGGRSKLDVRINLIRLGGSWQTEDGRKRFSCHCHREHHDGNGDGGLLAIVAQREGTTPEVIEEVMDLFSRLIRPAPWQLESALAELSAPAREVAERELREAGILA